MAQGKLRKKKQKDRKSENTKKTGEAVSLTQKWLYNQDYDTNNLNRIITKEVGNFHVVPS